MVVGFFFVGIYILLSGNKLTKEATDTFYSYNLEDKKNQLQREVLNRIDEIEFERNKILEDEKAKLFYKIHNVYSYLLNTEFSKITSTETRNNKLVEAFENIVSEDNDYSYFIVDKTGNLLRSGTDKKIEGTNLYNTIDIEGNYFIRNILKAKEVAEGIYVDYYWPKVKDGEPLKKTSYCLYLPEFDVVIGTGVYHNDIQIQLQNRIYERLQSYYEDKEDYIFVEEYDATARVAGDPNLVGKVLMDVTTLDGEPVHNIMMSIIQKEGSGFATYQINKRNDIALSEKISYVHILEGWDAYIGMGFYMDDLNEEVERYSLLFKKHYYNQVLYVIIGLMSIAILVFAVYQRGAFMQKMFFKQGDVIFEELFHLSNEAIIVLSNKGELLYENEIASRLFHKNTESYIYGNELSLAVETDFVYSFETDTKRTYYVNIRKETVSFKGLDSTIYFVNDITSEYIKSNVLEKMAYNDQLTGLLNRRALIDNLEDLSYDFKIEENYILGMIDVDKFKYINDTYGHSLGDNVLKILSDTFTSRLRSKDAFYRYGGEEFIILLKNISLERAKRLIEDLDKLFCDHVSEELGIECTFSGGLINIEYKDKDIILSEQIQKADRLMYQAKQKGRNCVEI